MLKGFDPIIPSAPVLMILGSMPSVSSLEKQEYYGYAHNRFWKILHHVYDMPINDYDEKKKILYEKQILLWDVISECEREGSLDSAIRNEKVNDIGALIIRYSTIRKVICNGKKAYNLYQRYFSDVNIPCIYLPSTSNANRSIKEEKLFELWEQELTKSTVL